MDWLSFICPKGYPNGSICLPCNVTPRCFGRAALNATIHGISAQKVYPYMMLPSNIVSSYLTFSPSPSFSDTSFRIKAVIFCGTFCSFQTRLFTGMPLYAVRTFLVERDSPVCRFCKVINN